MFSQIPQSDEQTLIDQLQNKINEMLIYIQEKKNDMND